jgi:hypothetical protein
MKRGIRGDSRPDFVSDNKIFSKSKRSQAGVVSAVLIILIVIAAVAIIWNVVNPMIQRSAEQVKGDVFTIQLEIQEVRLFYSGAAKVSIKRGPGEGELTGLKFVFHYEDGNTQIIEVEKDLPKELETKIYEFSSSEFESEKRIAKVSLAPVIGNSIGNEIEENKGKIKTDSEGNRAYYVADDLQMAEKYLVSWWTFDADVNDSIGENHGSLNGGRISGGSLIGRANVPDSESLSPDSEISMSLWFKSSSTGTVWLLHKYDANPYPGFGLRHHEGKLRLWAGGTGGGTWLDCLPGNVGVSSFVDNNWHHVVATAKIGGDKKIYADGKLCSSNAAGTIGLDASAQLAIAHDGSPTVDELIIFNVALDESEVKAIYEGQKR